LLGFLCVCGSKRGKTEIEVGTYKRRERERTDGKEGGLVGKKGERGAKRGREGGRERDLDEGKQEIKKVLARLDILPPCTPDLCMFRQKA
jgi:hypothetical protein